MSWQSVSAIFVFVAGAVVCAFTGAKELALVLAGGALGFARSDKRDSHTPHETGSK